MSPKVKIPCTCCMCNKPLRFCELSLHHQSVQSNIDIIGKLYIDTTSSFGDISPPPFRMILPENCCTISQAQKMLFAAKFAVGGGLCSRTSLSDNRRAEKIIIVEVFFASAFFLSFCLLWFGHSFLRSAFHTAAIVCGFSCSLKLWVRGFIVDSFVPKRSLISPWIVILVKEPLKPRPKQEGK